MFSSLLWKVINEDTIITFNLGWGDKAVKPIDPAEE